MSDGPSPSYPSLSSRCPAPGRAPESSFGPGHFGRRRHRDLVFLLWLAGAFVLGAWCMPPLAFGAEAVPSASLAPTQEELVRAISMSRWMDGLNSLVALSAGLFSITGLAYGLRARRETQRREVTFVAEYLTKEEAGVAGEVVDRRIEQLEEALRAIQAEWRDDRAALDRVNEDRLVRLHTRLDQVEKELQAQISNMPAQMIAILKNTGAIK